MRPILLVLTLAAALAAQTVVPPGMMRRWGGSNPAELRLYALGLDGFTPVVLGPGIRISVVGGVPTITAEPVPARIVSQVLQRDVANNYPCSECQRVYRNGLRMAEGIDYRQMPTGVMPLHSWSADDVVVGEWIGPPPEPKP
jgi:hypothetical protein